MKSIKSNTSTQSLENQDKENLNSKGTELVKRVELKDTPFMMVSVQDENTNEVRHFGTMGKWRVTELYDKQSKVQTELEKVTWNRLMQVIGIVLDEREEVKKITDKLLNKE